LSQLYYEYLEVQEDFIDFHQNSGGKVVSSSVVKKGQKDAFTYTHDMNVQKSNQTLHKKRNISAHEYLSLLEHKKEGFQTLKRRRICAIIKEIYYKIDYYPEVDGQPILLTM
jgi:hypothetical protein